MATKVRSLPGVMFFISDEGASLIDESAVFLITMATIRHYNLRRDVVGRPSIVRVLYRDGAFFFLSRNVLSEDAPSLQLYYISLYVSTFAQSGSREPKTTF